MQALEIFAQYKQLTPENVLASPEQFLGTNYKTILNFWLIIDNLTKEQWIDLDEKKNSLVSCVPYLKEAAEIEQNAYYLQLASWAVPYRKFSGLDLVVPIYATYEIIAMHQIIEEGKKFYVIPLFETI